MMKMGKTGVNRVLLATWALATLPRPSAYSGGERVMPATHFVGTPREGDDLSPERASLLDAALRDAGQDPEALTTEEFKGSSALQAYAAHEEFKGSSALRA
ncbi:hypothetical protein T484DRAFT_1792849 [Baffinella frigidus]|nr:hypothetical protein T484DRAFT_1792849 [Cryptophyta sp. CCMP2293]